MAKCRGVNNQGSVCGKPTRYKSDFCNNHRSQDPSFIVCMGKQNSSGRPCIREAVVGELFCKGHLTQKGDLEKLQCPRGCGLLTYRMGLNNAWFYHCKKCKGAMLDAKLLETKLAEDLALKFNNLLDASTKVGKLNCPSCEGLMFGFKIVYVMPEGGRGVGGLHAGDLNMGGAGLLGLLFVGAVIVAASSAGKDEGDYDEEEFGGSVMVIDGCKDCGNFWFDRKELKTVTVAEKIRAAKEWEEEATRPMLRPEWSPVQASGRASNTNCLHIDEKNGKNCRRVTFRGTEYCYMHQQD